MLHLFVFIVIHDIAVYGARDFWPTSFVSFSTCVHGQLLSLRTFDFFVVLLHICEIVQFLD